MSEQVVDIKNVQEVSMDEVQKNDKLTELIRGLAHLPKKQRKEILKRNGFKKKSNNFNIWFNQVQANKEMGNLISSYKTDMIQKIQMERDEKK